MREYLKKAMLLLSVMLGLAFAVPAAACAEGDEAAASYLPVSFYTLQSEEKLVFTEMDSYTVELVEPKEKSVPLPDEREESVIIPGGVMIKGKVGEFNTGRIQITDDYNFTGNPVWRISLDGVADRGVLGRAEVYLDDSEEPAAVIPLDNRTKKDGWDVGESMTQIVSDLEITGEHKVSVGFNLYGKDDSERVGVLLRSIEFAESTGLPTVNFNIDESEGTIEAMNQSEDHAVNCYGTMDVLVPDGFVSEYQDSPDESRTGLKMEYIRGRGNSTWDADKKPYKVKLNDKVDFFGMGENKHWVLLANRFDNSLVRNRMTYWLGDQMGMAFTPQCVPVDVVMNNVYLGSYLLCEQIRIDPNRVAIDELKKKISEGIELTGGYLMSMSPYGDEDERTLFETTRGVAFANEEPDFVEYENAAQTNYIRNFMQKTEDAIYSDDCLSSFKYMDKTSAIDYWWVQEFSMNGDAYITNSTRLYKTRDKKNADGSITEGKLYWGPLWDFDYVAWGDLEPIDRLHTNGLDYTNNPWVTPLLANRDFTDELAARWDSFSPLISEITREGGLLDTYYEQTRISERYDLLKYGFYGDEWNNEDIDGSGSELGEDTPPVEPEESDRTYADEILQLKTWINERQAWVDDNLDDIHNLTAYVTFEVDGEVIEKRTVKKGPEYITGPEAPEKEGYYFKGWFDEDGKDIEDCDEILKDTTFTARYVSADEAIKGDELYFKEDSVVVSLVSEDEYQFHPVFTVLPENADIKTVTWSSSDEDIAIVDELGRVKGKTPGTVTITGTLASGEEASYEITFVDGDTEPVPLEEICPEDDMVTLRIGEHARNPVILQPEGVLLEEYWLAFDVDSDDDVVLVDDTGVIYGFQAGTATVRVRDAYSEVEAEFEVMVLPEDGYDDMSIDAADQAFAMLKQLNTLVKPGDYTKSTYAAYAQAYSQVMKRLKEGGVPYEEVAQLRHMVIEAHMNLEKKKANTLQAKGKTVKVKAGKVKVKKGGKRKVLRAVKKTKKIAAKKAVKISRKNGKVTYKLAGVTKSSAKKYFSVNAKTGQITVKKGLVKGTYKVKIKVKAAGDANHKAGTKTVTVKVKVR